MLSLPVEREIERASGRKRVKQLIQIDEYNRQVENKYDLGFLLSDLYEIFGGFELLRCLGCWFQKVSERYQMMVQGI